MAPAPSGPAPPQAQATKKPLADTRRFGQAKATKKPLADTRRFGQAKATKDRRSPLGGHTAPGRLARPRPKRPGPVCPPRHSEYLALLEINKANPVISFVGNQQSLYVRPPRHTEARRRRLVRGPSAGLALPSTPLRQGWPCLRPPFGRVGRVAGGRRPSSAGLGFARRRRRRDARR